MIPGKPLSITVRLALLFTGVTILTFAAVRIYLYQALASPLERRDDAELLGGSPHTTAASIGSMCFILLWAST